LIIDALVIGGGIAGLSVAYELAQRGIGVLVLERSSRAGGVILSEQVDGFTIDAGPDALLVQKPEAIQLCEELGLGPRLIPTKPPRVAYIQRGGRLHALPAGSVLGIPTRITPFITTTLFTWAGKLRMAAELRVPPRTEEADESIGAFMTRRFGPEACTYLAEPLLAGIHAGDVDRLSVGSLFPRLVSAERAYGSLIRAFRAQRRAPAPVDGVFRSLPGGLTEMVRALTSKLPVDTLRLDTEAVRVELGDAPRGFTVATEAGQSFRARAVVVATPTYVTGKLVQTIDAELAALCGEIAYASTATVVLGYRREDIAHPLNGSGFVVPRVEGTGILAGSWMSSKWPDRAPADRVLLRAFVGGTRDPHALDEPDARLVDVSVSALTPLLGIGGDPILTRVYRWPRNTAQHEVGHAARLEAIERARARHPGLFLTGSGLRGVGIPDCVADGRTTGKQVAEWLAQSYV
jgi:oxygen-dependent protoporphyrinogen oxidase